MFSTESDDQKAYLEMVESFTEHQKVLVLSTYIDTMAMMEYDKLFISKPQRSVLSLVLLTWKNNYVRVLRKNM